MQIIKVSRYIHANNMLNICQFFFQCVWEGLGTRTCVPTKFVSDTTFQTVACLGEWQAGTFSRQSLFELTILVGDVPTKIVMILYILWNDQ